MENDPIRKVKVNATFTYRLGDQIKSEGNHGTLVFKGFFNGTIPIALKRYQKVDENTIKDVEKDLDILASPKNRHPNFIRYYGHTSDDNFSYLATELCECSVADIIDPKRITKAKDKTIYFEAIVASLPKKEILRQSSEAVSFLHRPQWNMIHRNLHPDNFLIACVDPNKDYFLIKLTDFQLSKSIEKNPQNTGTLNKEGWVAPESFKDKIELDNKVDAFILGCYYFYVLSGGKHPFGRGVVDQRTRIKDINDKVYQASWDGKPEWEIDQVNKNEKEDAEWALEMIKGLIKYNPNDRKSVIDTLKSKYFQPEPYVIYDNNPAALKAGLCVILTQSKYHNATMDVGSVDTQGIPKGIEIDSKNLENTFKNFGYQVLHFKNLRARQMIQFLSPEQLARDASVTSLDEFASLIFCILGHGEKDAVIGVDGTPVPLNKLQYAFNDVLRDKPKIFIVLSCRGDHDQLILDRNDPFFNPAMVTTVNLRTSSSNGTPPLIDFLSLMSTMEEFQTYFDPNMGSEFVNALCDALRREYNVDDSINKKDLVQLFSTVVIPRVGRSEIRMTLPQVNGPDRHYIIKQTPESRSSLTKTIRFRNCGTAPGAVRLVYDGEIHDPSFEIGRSYFRTISPPPPRP